MRRALLTTTLVAATAAVTGIATASSGLPTATSALSTPVVGPGLAYVDPGPGGFASPNLDYVATIPVEGAGVSMEVVTVGTQRRAYLSGAAGLSIYDITDPALPIPMGHLPIYNWENEDVAVSDDGKTVLLTEFTANAYLHVVDTTNPALPTIAGSIIQSGPHTVQCANPTCTFVFGSNGATFDLRDKTKPVRMAKGWGNLLGAQLKPAATNVSGHALKRDASGLWTVDSSGHQQFRLTDGDPLKPALVGVGGIGADKNTPHNNIRPRAEKYAPRTDGTTGLPLRDGELILSEGETNFSGTCGANQGSLTSYQMTEGKAWKELNRFNPVNGNYMDKGDPAVNALGCSGHWFNVRDSDQLIAAAWYEHGTRLLKVDPADGKIKQVGFFQPVRGSASQAYWIPGTDYIYTVDYQRGFDILKYDATAPVPTEAEFAQSWLAKLKVVDQFSALERELCRKAMDAAELS